MVPTSRPLPSPTEFAVPSRRAARAMTLVEMLVALTITLMMMGVVVTYFAGVAGGVAESRAQMEMADMLRGARNQLQNDLAGATCPTLPWARSDMAAGYFEYYEGPLSDTTDFTSATTAGSVPRTLLGDHDDVLMFTSKSRDEKFVGHNGGSSGVPFQSDIAEVVWWSAVESTLTQRIGFRTVYRRVLLVAPGMASQVDSADFTIGASWTLEDFQIKYDLSAHVYYDPAGMAAPQIVLNTLNDLTDRKNRYCHAYSDDPATGYAFPHAIIRAVNLAAPTPDPGLKPFPSDSTLPGYIRFGEDVVLRNVLAFDVRAFDPLAPLRSINSVVVGPGEHGWTPGGTLVPADGNGIRYAGAFVDLGYNQSGSEPAPATTYGLPSHFSRPAAGSIGNTWDTWPALYESDGLNQDVLAEGMTPLIDEGTNGYDDDGANGVDDPGERETQPPYPFALRGIQVMFRLYEPDSRQTRQVTLVQNFVPE